MRFIELTYGIGNHSPQPIEDLIDLSLNLGVRSLNLEGMDLRHFNNDLVKIPINLILDGYVGRQDSDIRYTMTTAYLKQYHHILYKINVSLILSDVSNENWNAITKDLERLKHTAELHSVEMGLFLDYFLILENDKFERILSIIDILGIENVSLGSFNDSIYASDCMSKCTQIQKYYDLDCGVYSGNWTMPDLEAAEEAVLKPIIITLKNLLELADYSV